MPRDVLQNMFIALGIVILFILGGGDLYERLLELLRIVIWPGVILFAVFYFRKVFAYLFFSLEEFSFFGVKGNLKDVTEMIEEKAREIRDKEKSQEENEKKLEELKNSNAGQGEQLDDMMEFAEELLKQNDELSQEVMSLKNVLIKERSASVNIASLQNQVSAILNQIQSLQAQPYRTSLRNSEPPDEEVVNV